MKMELSRHYTLQSARALKGIDEEHQCARLHGHTFQVRVSVLGEVKMPEGWVVDFAEMDQIWEETIKVKLDHVLLNDVPGLENPTTELLTKWIFEHYQVPGTTTVAVDVNETGYSRVRYTG